MTTHNRIGIKDGRRENSALNNAEVMEIMDETKPTYNAFIVALAGHSEDVQLRVYSDLLDAKRASNAVRSSTDEESQSATSDDAS